MIDIFKLYEKIGYKICHPEVMRFHRSTARVKVCVAPRRTTKSFSAAKEALKWAIQPGKRVRIIGPDYDTADKEFQYIYEDLVLKKDRLGLPAPTAKKIRGEGSHYLHFPWGSIVETRSATRPESLLGEKVDLAVYSEAAQMKRVIREKYVSPCLVTTKGTELVPTTPESTAQWVYDLWERGKREDMPEIESFQWDISANPTYPKEEFEYFKRMYGEHSPIFREQFKGEWVFYTGLVFSTFNYDSNVINPFSIPDTWPRYRGIDFGHRDAFVCLWCAVGPTGELYFYKEYYSEDEPGVLRDIPIHAANIKGMTDGEMVTATYADPAGKQQREDLAMNGISTIGWNNEREAGRLRVVQYMAATSDNSPPYPRRKDGFEPSHKFPKMFFFEGEMEKTLEELKFYRWRETNLIEGQKEKTEGADHACDVVRGLTMTRPAPYRLRPVDKEGTFRWHHRKNKRMETTRISAR